MKSFPCGELRIFLFEGTKQEVDIAVNQWLKGQGELSEVVDIQYNYQGPEYDGAGGLADFGTHGVLITIRFLSINEIRRRRGYPTLGKHEEGNHGSTQDEAARPDGY